MDGTVVSGWQPEVHRYHFLEQFSCRHRRNGLGAGAASLAAWELRGPDISWDRLESVRDVQPGGRASDDHAHSDIGTNPGIAQRYGIEHGDPNTPYILGGLWNSKGQPPLTKDKATKEGKTQQHMIKTQAGHLFIFDDTSGKEQIVIRDKSTKNEIIINTKDNTILINADKDIKLTAKGNISFTATQDLLFDGANFKVTTKQDSTFGATNFKVDAKANLNLAGLKIDAQGKTGVNLATAGLGKIEISPAKTSINAGGLDVM